MSRGAFCPNGHPLAPNATDSDARTCPRCGALLPARVAGPGRVGLADLVMNAKSRSRDDDDEDDDLPPKKRARVQEEDDEDDDRPRKRRKRDEEDDDDDDVPVERKLTKKQRAMKLVRLGITFHIVKLWT